MACPRSTQSKLRGRFVENRGPCEARSAPPSDPGWNNPRGETERRGEISSRLVPKLTGIEQRFAQPRHPGDVEQLVDARAPEVGVDEGDTAPVGLAQRQRQVQRRQRLPLAGEARWSPSPS